MNTNTKDLNGVNMTTVVVLTFFIVAPLLDQFSHIRGSGRAVEAHPVGSRVESVAQTFSLFLVVRISQVQDRHFN